MPHHADLTIYHGIHGILAGTIANGANLTAGIVHDAQHPDGRAVTTTDVGKVFQRMDNGVWYGLFSIAPVNWWVMGDGALNAFEHGNLPGGTLHAVATTTVNGFYAAADKVANDDHRSNTNNPHSTTAAQVGAIATQNPMSVTGTPGPGAVLTATSGTTATWQAAGSGGVPSTRAFIAGAGLTGGGDFSADRTINVGAHPDGSILVNPDTVQVGVLATDAQHGTRGGGTQHALATTSMAGFLSAADKLKLDGLSSSAALSNAAPLALGAAASGTSGQASRGDHVHPHGNQAGGSLHALATTSTPGFLSAADKVKLDTVDTSIFARLAGGNEFSGDQVLFGEFSMLGHFTASGTVQAGSISTGGTPQWLGDIASGRDVSALVDIYAYNNIFSTNGRIYTGATEPPSVGDIRAGNNLIAANAVVSDSFQFPAPRQFTRRCNIHRDVATVGVAGTSWYVDTAGNNWHSNTTTGAYTLLIAIPAPAFSTLNRITLRVSPGASRTGTNRMRARVYQRDRFGTSNPLTSDVFDAGGTTSPHDILFDNINFAMGNEVIVAVMAGSPQNPSHDLVISCEYTFTASELVY